MTLVIEEADDHDVPKDSANEFDDNLKEKAGEVVVEKSEDEKPDANLDQDLIENDDDDGVDVKGQISNVSDRKSITKDDEENEQQLNHKLAPKVLDENKNVIAEADDKFKAKLPNKFNKAEAENECNEVKSLFEGTFLQNYVDILESIEKILENEEDVEGNEIKEKDSKSEDSRHEMKPAHDEETLANVKHEPYAREVFQDLMLVCLIQIILTMLNTLVNVMKKPGSASLWFPMLKILPHSVPIMKEKLLTESDSIKMDLEEDVVVDQTASADTIMVT